ncbi:invasin domain 3-containing protein [uncultured Shewanella sp.]|uniref:invasin domain 3-containing protein n=1 Tax=uncultured Shewanella sp. TaxID=173975 RepID=UPI00261D1065|nr:invasin domain 3-containing protein [uncultured Shewanella sp.]
MRKIKSSHHHANQRLFTLLIMLCSLLFISSCNDSEVVQDDNLVDKEITLQLLVNSESTSNESTSSNISWLEGTFSLDIGDNTNDTIVTLTDGNEQTLLEASNGVIHVVDTLKVPSSGILTLKARITNLDETNPPNITVKLQLSHQSFFSAISLFDIMSGEESITNHIELMAKENTTDFASSYNQTSVNVTGNTVNGSVSLDTPILSSNTLAGQIMDGASASITIPDNTPLFDANGDPFIAEGEVSMAIKFISADPNGLAPFETNPLFNFPGGLDIDNFEGDGPADLNGNQNISFISAGFVAIEIHDEANNQVSQFGSDGVTLNFNVPKSTINPNTQLPLSFDDASIPLWSYDQTTGEWRYEGSATILTENTDTFTLETQITHLSYYNLDWYGSDRCKLNIDVVDQDGVANNQSLQVSFTRESGGWARKKYGWGEPLDQLNIQRVPAFKGYFHLFDANNNPLLASIEVDNEQMEITDTAKGILLDDFCFGETNDSEYTFTAKLNISNPPRIDISPSVTLVCPIDDTQTATATEGWYALYENYAYKGSGQLDGETLNLTNLTEDANYLFYYSGPNDWGRSEFTATSNLTDIRVDALSLCPTIEQTLNVQFVCLDEDQNILKSKPASAANHWVYNSDYWQYMWGEADSNGSSELTQTIEGFEYFAYVYARHGSDFYWFWAQDTFEAEENTTAEIDIALPESDEFCQTDLSLDLTTSTFTASSSTAAAGDTNKITLSVQAKDEFGNNITLNADELSFSATPSDPITIDNIQNLGNGTFSADAYSNTVGTVEITATIGSETLTNTVTLTFTNTLSLTNDIFTSDVDSVIANNSDVVTLNLQTYNLAGTPFGESAGDLSFTLPTGYTLVTNVNNEDGTYTTTISGIKAGTLTLTPMLDSQALSTNLNIEFTQALDINQSSFSISSDTVDADGSSTTIATVMLRDYNNEPYLLSDETLTFTIDGTAIEVSSTDEGNGNHTATFSSTTAGEVIISAHVADDEIGQGTVTFTATGPSASESTLTLSANAISTESTVTATVSLKTASGDNYTQSGGALAVTVDDNVTVSNENDHGNGTYTFDLTSSVADNYTVSVTIGDVSLDNTQAVSFTSVDVSRTVITPDPLTIIYVNPSTAGSITISLLQADDSLVGHGGHTISFTGTYLDVNFITHDGTIDNSDGTYTATFSCLGVYPSNADITTHIDGIESVAFQIDCD